ncbi:hypothetical protein KSP39_PZI024502 [Platanthera zijinensis]|uniref:AtPDCT1/2 transmembrane domain-containing protein n=1 Tax=Platanthera zijinensis TaxID=2320716 RepID=A0AAP0ATL1_9ASPA
MIHPLTNEEEEDCRRPWLSGGPSSARNSSSHPMPSHRFSSSSWAWSTRSRWRRLRLPQTTWASSSHNTSTPFSAQTPLLIPFWQPPTPRTVPFSGIRGNAGSLYSAGFAGGGEATTHHCSSFHVHLPSISITSQLDINDFSMQCNANLFEKFLGSGVDFPPGNMSFLFFSGHIAGAIIASRAMRRMRRHKLASAFDYINALQALRLLAARGHYTIDLAVGIAAGFFFDILAGKYQERNNVSSAPSDLNQKVVCSSCNCR